MDSPATTRAKHIFQIPPNAGQDDVLGIGPWCIAICPADPGARQRRVPVLTSGGHIGGVQDGRPRVASLSGVRAATNDLHPYELTQCLYGMAGRRPVPGATPVTQARRRFFNRDVVRLTE